MELAEHQDALQALLKKQRENEQNASSKLGVIIIIVAAVLLLFALVKPSLLSILLVPASIIGFIIGIVINAACKKAKKDIPVNAEKILQEEQVVSECENILNRVKQNYAESHYIRRVLCPAECSDPRYLRKFIHLLESGRASDLKEAYTLFDETLHREKMEGLATAQVRASLAAERAANAAVAAANNAAYEAGRARTSADWAAYQSKYNN